MSDPLKAIAEELAQEIKGYVDRRLEAIEQRLDALIRALAEDEGDVPSESLDGTTHPGARDERQGL